MSVEPDLRIALGFVLFLRAAIGFCYSGTQSGIGIFGELRKLPVAARAAEVIARGLLVLPIMLFLFVGEPPLGWGALSMALLDDFSRCAMLIPAVLGLILGIWSFHSAMSPTIGQADAPTARAFLTGPFRVVRYPHWLADLILLGSSLIAMANWLGIVALAASVLLLTCRYFPLADEAWRRFLGNDYDGYAARTGWILPPLRSSARSQAGYHVVPRRFAISEIMAIVTMFAVMFGAINGLQGLAPDFKFAPVLNLYLGVQLLAICVGQMLFGGSPRMVSVLVGAIALPAFVVWQERPRSPQYLLIFVTVLVIFGALVGYCLGVVAAGLFLLLDWVRPYVPLLRGRAARGSPDPAQPPDRRSP